MKETARPQACGQLPEGLGCDEEVVSEVGVAGTCMPGDVVERAVLGASQAESVESLCDVVPHRAMETNGSHADVVSLVRFTVHHVNQTYMMSGRAHFEAPDLARFCRLDELGLAVTCQRLEPERAVLMCRVVEQTDSDEQWCRRCGGEGVPRDSVSRRLAHEPFGWRPTTLLLTIRRYRCTECGHVWRQDTSTAAEPRAKLSRRALAWALEYADLATDAGLGGPGSA